MQASGERSHERYSAVDGSGEGHERSLSREDHSGSQFKSRLLNSKTLAKETELEALALRNRIAILEKEEQKVLKKIEGAKKQALEILGKKNRNHKVNEEKEKFNSEKARELEAKRVQVTNKKEEMKEKVQVAVEERVLTSKERAEEIKENMKVVLGQTRN